MVRRGDNSIEAILEWFERRAGILMACNSDIRTIKPQNLFVMIGDNATPAFAKFSWKRPGSRCRKNNTFEGISRNPTFV